MLDTYRYNSYFTKYPYLWEQDQPTIEAHALHLSQIVRQLIQMETGFPEDFDPTEVEILDLTLQQKLNRLHRYFTTFTQDSDSRGLQWATDVPVVGSNDKQKFSKMFELAHQINGLVHLIENYVTTPHKEKFLENPQRTDLEIEFDVYENTNEASKSIQVKGDRWNYMTPDDFAYLSNDPKFDVWLPDNILGKPYNRAYYDHDDPTQWDITHNIGYTGNFQVGSRTNKATEMQTPEIQEWLRSYGIEPGPATCGMPLGYITSGREFLDQWWIEADGGQLNDLTIELHIS
jgi:hypothetical protein